MPERPPDALPPSPDAREAAKKLGRKLCAWDAISGQPAVMQFIEDKIAAALTAFAARTESARSRDADATDIHDALGALHVINMYAGMIRRWTVDPDGEVRAEAAKRTVEWAATIEAERLRAHEIIVAHTRSSRAASQASSAAPSVSAARQTDATTEDVERDAVVRYLRETLVGNHPAYADTFRHAAHQIEHNAHRMGVSPAATAASRNAEPAPALPDAGAPTRSAPETGERDRLRTEETQ